MLAEAISIQHQDAVYTLELARPECGNLITMDMITGLARGPQALPVDTKLVVIRGRGADFCKGRDYPWAPETAREGQAPSACAIIDALAAPVSTRCAR